MRPHALGLRLAARRRAPGRAPSRAVARTRAFENELATPGANRRTHAAPWRSQSTIKA